MVNFENNLLNRGSQISTPIYRDTEPGVSSAKIGVQTWDLEEDIKEYLKSIYYGIIDKDICNKKYLANPVIYAKDAGHSWKVFNELNNLFN